MNTKKISHIGVLVHDADAATRLWTESFGCQKFADRKIEFEGICGMHPKDANGVMVESVARGQ